MEFGKVHPDELEHIDFTLPKDHPITAQTLKGKKRHQDARIVVGAAKWGRPDWVGLLYPNKTKASDFFVNYVQHFSSIELNATFYQTNLEDIKRWKKIAPTGFLFCPKFNQSISHYRRLKDADQLTDEFFDKIAHFEENLGHVFLQLHDNFSPNASEQLLSYLQKWHKHMPIALEVRSKAWFDNSELSLAMFRELQKLDVATVITDAAGRRDCVHQILTNEVAFIRYVGNSLHPTDFIRIDSWVDRISEWIDKGVKTIYFFIHNHDERYTPELAKYAIEKLNNACKTSIPEIRLQSDHLLF